MSFMCSWRDALTLPESLPENSKNEAPHLATGLLWEPETPGPLPLLPPGPDPWDPGVTAQDLLFRGAFPFRRKPQAVLDVTEQLSRFLWDHGDIAFAPLGKLMLENFKLEGARLPLGLPQLPTAPVLHRRGPRPGQVSGQPPGGAAARGAGHAVGATAPGRRIHRGRSGLGARGDTAGGTVGLPCGRCSRHALYPFVGGRRGWRRLPLVEEVLSAWSRRKAGCWGTCSDWSS